MSAAPSVSSVLRSEAISALIERNRFAMKKAAASGRKTRTTMRQPCRPAVPGAREKPATGPIAAVAAGGVVGRRGGASREAVMPGRPPESTAQGGVVCAAAARDWLEVEINDAPVASDGVDERRR